MTTARWLLLGGLLTACGRPERQAPDWAGVFYHPDTGMDTTTTAPPPPGRPRPWLAANWDPSSRSCEPVALPRAACEADRELPTAKAGTVPCTEHTDCADDEFCGEGYCRSAWYDMVLVCVHEASFVGPVEIPPGEVARTPPDLRGMWRINPAHYVGWTVHTDLLRNECAPMWRPRCEIWQAGGARLSTVELEQKGSGEGYAVVAGSLFGDVFGGISTDWTEKIRSVINGGCQVVSVYDGWPTPVLKGQVVVSIHYPATRW